MKKLIIGLFIFGLTTQVFSQVIELSEVNVSVNYKYLDAINYLDAMNSDPVAVPVKTLTEQVLNYKVNNGDLYDDEFGTHSVSFYIPDGKIVAAYDKNGKILRTIEKYKNIRLPQDVLQAIAEKYPNWAVVEDVYEVNFHCDKGIVKKQYKIKLQNEDETVKIKTDGSGNFI